MSAAGLAGVQPFFNNMDLKSHLKNNDLFLVKESLASLSLSRHIVIHHNSLARSRGNAINSFTDQRLIQPDPFNPSLCTFGWVPALSSPGLYKRTQSSRPLPAPRWKLRPREQPPAPVRHRGPDNREERKRRTRDPLHGATSSDHVTPHKQPAVSRPSMEVVKVSPGTHTSVPAPVAWCGFAFRPSVCDGPEDFSRLCELLRRIISWQNSCFQTVGI